MHKLRHYFLTDKIVELKQPSEVIVARARDLINTYFLLELTVKVDTQVADCAGAFSVGNFAPDSDREVHEVLQTPGRLGRE